MSWGERSCSLEKAPMNEHGGCSVCTMGNCNVDCKYYTWDGVTKPDSEKYIPRTNLEAKTNRKLPKWMTRKIHE